MPTKVLPSNYTTYDDIDYSCKIKFHMYILLQKSQDPPSGNYMKQSHLILQHTGKELEYSSSYVVESWMLLSQKLSRML